MDDDMRTIQITLQTVATEQGRMAEQIKGALKRIDEQAKFVSSVQEIATSVKILALEIQQAKERIGRLGSDVEALKEKPAKRWESVVGLVITGIITGLVGFLLAKFGI